MSNKVALVTGGGRGIGASICKSLAKAGYYVYVNVRKKSHDSEMLLDEITMIGGAGTLIEFDVAKKREVRVAEKCFEHDHLNILINNAGIIRSGLLYNLEWGDWKRIIEVNFFGAVNVFEQFRERLGRTDSAVVVNMGSISGIRPRKGQGGYPVSKAMLIDWTSTQAKLWEKEGIRFYAVSPGAVDTKMVKSDPWYKKPENIKQIPLGRLADPEEVAELVLLLSGPEGIFKNGSNIIFDGGVSR